MNSASIIVTVCVWVYVLRDPLGGVSTSESASGGVRVVCKFTRKNAKLHSPPRVAEIPHCSSPPAGEFLQSRGYISMWF